MRKFCHYALKKPVNFCLHLGININLQVTIEAGFGYLWGVVMLRMWVGFIEGCTRFCQWLVTPSYENETYQEAINRNKQADKEWREEMKAFLKAERAETNARLERCLEKSIKEHKKQ